MHVVKDAHVKPHLYNYFYGVHLLCPTLPCVIVIMHYVQQVTQHTALGLCYRRTEAAAIHFPQRVVGITESRTTIIISVLQQDQSACPQTSENATKSLYLHKPPT